MQGSHIVSKLHLKLESTTQNRKDESNMNFTERMGIAIPQADITIRNDAPVSMRRYIFQLMQNYEPSLKVIRRIVSFVTKEAEDLNNWSENDFMKNEIQEMIENCSWNEVYDITEAFHCKLSVPQKRDFEKNINEYFAEKGIGWKMQNGIIETRGDDIFEDGIKQAKLKLQEKGLGTSQNEIKEAIADLSRRSTPDITGSIQHSVAALECVCREVTRDKKATLGTLINNHPDIVPKPLDDVIKKIWGFSSEQGRHLQEGRDPSYEEAELLVHLSASLCVYLTNKL